MNNGTSQNEKNKDFKECVWLTMFIFMISVCVQRALSSGLARGTVTKVCDVNSRQHNL